MKLNINLDVFYIFAAIGILIVYIKSYVSFGNKIIIQNDVDVSSILQECSNDIRKDSLYPCIYQNLETAKQVCSANSNCKGIYTYGNEIYLLNTFPPIFSSKTSNVLRTIYKKK
jgi:hypothetical protein